MGNPKGVRRDFRALEARRQQALKFFEQDLNNSEIGRRLKVSNQTVSRWRAAVNERGASALKAAGRAGRKALLNDSQRRHLIAGLRQGPERLGYETPLWTCARVAHLIHELFDIVYHPGHVWKLLGQLGWSPQRPVGRAIERDEAAIEEWKRKTWPTIKKQPVRKGVRSSSSTRAD